MSNLKNLDLKILKILTLISLLMLILTLGYPWAMAASSLSGSKEKGSNPAVSIQSWGPPPPDNWQFLDLDPDEGVWTNLKEIYWQSSAGILYFKVIHYRKWTTIDDIDTGIFLDTDQDPATGLPDGTYPGQDNDMGADFDIVVGWEGTEMWKWVGSWWDLANPIQLAYLNAPSNTDTFIVGVYLSDLGVPTHLREFCIDVSVTDVESGWDWMPDSGHVTLCIRRPVGGFILPVNRFVIATRLLGLISLVVTIPIIIGYSRRQRK